MSFIQDLLKPGGGIALIPFIRGTIVLLLLMVMYVFYKYVLSGAPSLDGCSWGYTTLVSVYGQCYYTSETYDVVVLC